MSALHPGEGCTATEPNSVAPELADGYAAVDLAEDVHQLIGRLWPRLRPRSRPRPRCVQLTAMPEPRPDKGTSAPIAGPG